MIKPHNDETHHHAYRVSLCPSKRSTKRILNELDSSKPHERSKKNSTSISAAFSNKRARILAGHLDQALEKDFNTLLPHSAQSKQQQAKIFNTLISLSVQSKQKRAPETRAVLPFTLFLNLSTAHQRHAIERLDAFVLSRIFHTLGSRMIFIQKTIGGFISDLTGFEDHTRLGPVLGHQLLLSMRKVPFLCGQTRAKRTSSCV